MDEDLVDLLIFSSTDGPGKHSSNSNQSLNSLDRSGKEPCNVVDTDVSEYRPMFPRLFGATETAQTHNHPLSLDLFSAIPVRIPGPIVRHLLHHQIEGVRFMYEMFADPDSAGCILADDMGLGKTIQVIAFLCAIFGKTGYLKDDKYADDSKPRLAQQALVICPASLVHKWEAEFITWSFVRTGIFQGDRDKRETLNRIRLGKCEVAITSYDTFCRCLDVLNDIEWDCVVADEVHIIKNGQSSLNHSLQSLKCIKRIGLTGTMLQNDYSDVWCLMRWANPLIFENAAKFEGWSKIIREGQRRDATSKEIADGRLKSSELQRVIQPHFLRRTKEILSKELPTKTELDLFCPITDLQHQVIGRFIDQMADPRASCGCSKAMKILGECKCNGALRSEFQVISFLRKSANHLSLLYSTDPDDHHEFGKKSESNTISTDYFEKYIAGKDILEPELSGKLQALAVILEYCYRRKDRVLIFSHWVSILNIIQKSLESKRYSFLRIDGRTKVDRAAIAKEFNNDPDIFATIISMKAGGVGLDFTSANIVIIFDVDWNPTYEIQAQDRAYRIGQKRPVTVYRLVAAGTIEELIYKRQIQKIQQSNVINLGSKERRHFSGVMKSRKIKGELFGMENILGSYRDMDQQDLDTVFEILKNTERNEAKMFMYYREFFSSDSTGESSRKSKTFNSDASNEKMDRELSSNLGEMGVRYIDHHKLLTSSKIEDFISSQALAEKETLKVKGRISRIFGKTPAEEQRRQLKQMSEKFGFGGEVEFSRAILSATSAQRQHWLMDFYKDFDNPMN